MKVLGPLLLLNIIIGAEQQGQTEAAAAVCLRPIVKFRDPDFSYAGTQKGVVTITEDYEDETGGTFFLVARSRHGIYRVSTNKNDSNSTASPPPSVDIVPVGDHFGTEVEDVTIVNNNIVAISTEQGDVTVHKYHPNNKTLSLQQVVARTLREGSEFNISGRGIGVSMNGDATVLATTLASGYPFDEGEVGIFNIKDKNPIPERVVTGPVTKVLLSSSGTRFVAVSDSCIVESPDGNDGTVRLQIYSRNSNNDSTQTGSSGSAWNQELDVWGKGHLCKRFGYPGLSVSMNEDATLVAVGAFNNVTNTTAVSVYAATTEESTTSQMATSWILRDFIEIGIEYRNHVALSNDGMWLGVGMPLFNTTDPNLITGTNRVVMFQYDTITSKFVQVASILGTNETMTLGNGIAFNKDATRLVVGMNNSAARFYDVIVDDDDGIDECEQIDDDEIFEFPADNTACEDTSITKVVSSPVFHLVLKDTIVGYEDSNGFRGTDDSVVQIFDVKNWNFDIQVGRNFTNSNGVHQDVVLAAKASKVAVLSTDVQILDQARNFTNDEFATIQVFSIADDKTLVDQGTITGPFDATAGSIEISPDGSVIVAAIYKPPPARGLGGEYALQAYTYVESSWVPLGYNITRTTALGQFSLSHTDPLLLAVGDSSFGEDREGHVRIFELRDDDWHLLAEFVGDPTQDEGLGWSISINAPGTVVAAGVLFGQDNYGIREVGAVKVFHNDGGIWRLRDRFSVGNRADYFSYSLALSGDGNRLAVGSFPSRSERCIVRLFEYDTMRGFWKLTFRDRGLSYIFEDDVLVDLTRYSLGQSVALNEDGSLMASGSAASRYVTSSQSNYVRVYNLTSCMAPSIPPSPSILPPSGRPTDGPSLGPKTVYPTFGPTLSQTGEPTAGSTTSPSGGGDIPSPDGQSDTADVPVILEGNENNLISGSNDWVSKASLSLAVQGFLLLMLMWTG